MQNIWLKVRNIMSQKWRFFCHRSSRFHYSLFILVCGGFAAAKNTKELKQTVQSGLKAQAVSLSGTLIFVQNFENDSAAFPDFVKR